jgi:uracil-DNA glycosylase family 4
MPWSERQAAMLREMGIRLWQPPPPEPGAAAPAVVAAEMATVQVAEHSPVVAVTPSLGGVAGLGWDDLRDAVTSCTACGLCKGRRQTVFGVGHQRAQWMIVGEAPGEQEDIQGEPFVGKSGQLLDNMLRAIGLGRAELQGVDADAAAARQVYIANTIKCRPPGNRNPEPDELARCEPFLIRQLQLVQPKIILAMGRFAVQSLLRSSDPIGRLRGRVHQYQGVPLIVTYHPAYLLRNPQEKAKAWDDLCLAVAAARGAVHPSPA